MMIICQKMNITTLYAVETFWNINIFMIKVVT